VTWQLGNLYLLLGFLGIAILSTTNETKVVRAYLIALWLGDVGHIGFSSYGLGWDMLMSLPKWNATTWGNIAMTVSHRNKFRAAGRFDYLLKLSQLFLFFTRTAYLTGLFGKEIVTPFAPKKDI
jgi:hypothetical protein